MGLSHSLGENPLSLDRALSAGHNERCGDMTTLGTITSALREFRLARELTQAELAQRVGISRQALSSIEAGTSVPGTDVALRLAYELGVRVEQVFRLDKTLSEVDAILACGSQTMSARNPARVVLAEVAGRWVAHPIDQRQRGASALVADGLMKVGRGKQPETVRVEPLGDLDVARQRLTIMGCAPALGLLAGRLGEDPSGVRVSWIQGSSTTALDALRGDGPSGGSPSVRRDHGPI